MESINIEIVDTVIRLEYRDKALKYWFAEYVTDKPADFTVCATEEDIEKARSGFWETHNRDNYNGKDLTPAFAEFLALHRCAAQEMLRRDVLVLHGSAVEANGRGYLFIAPSGTGKTTHTLLWRDLPEIGARIINDDKPMLRLDEDGVSVFASPWGMLARPEPDRAPLRAIVLLERGENNEIAPLSTAKMFAPLYGATHRGETAEDAKRALDLLSQTISSVKLFKLRCNMQPEAAQVAYRTLSTC